MRISDWSSDVCSSDLAQDEQQNGRMSNRMAGKVALVTGAASGLGAAQARLFAKEGAKVVVADMNVEMGNKVVAEVKESGGEALFVRVGVTAAARVAGGVE